MYFANLHIELIDLAYPNLLWIFFEFLCLQAHCGHIMTIAVLAKMSPSPIWWQTGPTLFGAVANWTPWKCLPWNTLIMGTNQCIGGLGRVCHLNLCIGIGHILPTIGGEILTNTSKLVAREVWNRINQDSYVLSPCLALSPFAIHILSPLDMRIHQVPHNIYHTYWEWSKSRWNDLFFGLIWVISELGSQDYIR